MAIRLMNLAPLTDAEWTGFQGAEAFLNGDRPVMAGVFAFHTEAAVLIAGQGISLLVEDQEVASLPFRLPVGSALEGVAAAVAELQKAFVGGTVRLSLLRRHGWIIRTAEFA